MPGFFWRAFGWDEEGGFRLVRWVRSLLFRRPDDAGGGAEPPRQDASRRVLRCSDRYASLL